MSTVRPGPAELDAGRRARRSPSWSSSVAGSRTSGGIIDRGTGRRASPGRRAIASAASSVLRLRDLRRALLGDLPLRTSPAATRWSSSTSARIATVGPAARRWPRSRRRASSSSGLTTRATRPIRSASAASTNSPSRASSFALPIPTSRGRSHEQPKSIDRPRRTKIALNRARVEAMTRSQPSARDIPAPAARPSTAAIDGLVSRCSASAASVDARPSPPSCRDAGVAVGASVRQVHAAREGARDAAQHERAVRRRSRRPRRTARPARRTAA